MMGQQIPSHQQQPQQVLPHPMQQPYQFQSIQGFPLAQPADTRSQQPVPLGQYSSPQPTTPVYSQGLMPQRRAQAQMANLHVVCDVSKFGMSMEFEEGWYAESIEHRFSPVVAMEGMVKS